VHALSAVLDSVMHKAPYSGYVRGQQGPSKPAEGDFEMEGLHPLPACST